MMTKFFWGATMGGNYINISPCEIKGKRSALKFLIKLFRVFKKLAKACAALFKIWHRKRNMYSGGGPLAHGRLLPAP